MKGYLTSIGVIIFCLAMSLVGRAQEGRAVDPASYFFQSQPERWGLKGDDVKDLQVTHRYRSEHNGVTHSYVQQRLGGVPIFNAISGVHQDANGQVVFSTFRFLSDIGSRAKTTVFRLSGTEALGIALEELGLATDQLPEVNGEGREAIPVMLEEVSNVPIRVEPVFRVDKSRELIPAWSIAILPNGLPEYWRYHIHAGTGEILERVNLATYCSPTSAFEGLQVRDFPAIPPSPAPALNTSLGPQYRVFPFQIANPFVGTRALLDSPSDFEASPFGWHDVDGIPGEEFTYTRGNNTYSYLDTSNQNSADPELTANGGPGLIFDFPFSLEGNPRNQREAALTQAFYTNNVLHDLTYLYGFTEAAGNFQQTNYRQDGVPGDPILVEVQDGGSLNNANIAVGPDGSASRMQLYLWDRRDHKFFRVESPESIAGPFQTGRALFGPELSNERIEGSLVLVRDEQNSTSLACGPLANGSVLAGKIALLDRGNCKFEAKTRRVEAEGAIACIVCNYENRVINMGGDPAIPNPAIPTLMLGAADCALLKNKLNQGREVRVVLQGPEDESADRIDGAFDNTLLIHEFVHGLTIRLTGGASQSECLRNDEQMGEGWSDFLALALTVGPLENGAQARHFGHYLLQNGTEGPGIRRSPYSTDFALNDFTYEDIIDTQTPHSLGELWAVMLWDLYWTFIDLYGYDEDLFRGTGGNNQALQLVIDGLTLQACNPGFVDGRDAILAADSILNDGVNSCLIWEVFAKRGLGFSAMQGSSFNRNDARAAFDLPPSCSQDLFLTKEMTSSIEPGEPISVQLKLTNFRNEPVSGVLVEDQIPAGSYFKAGSGQEVTPKVEGEKLVFELGTLQAGESRTLRYILETPESEASLSVWKIPAGPNENWDVRPQAGETPGWTFISEDSSLANAWEIAGSSANLDQILALQDAFWVSGELPVFRFRHQFRIEPAYQAGIVEVSEDGGENWINVTPYLFRGPRPGNLSFQVFALPDQQGLWGETEETTTSYLDLSAFKGKEIQIRFRFGSSNLGMGSENHFWRVEEAELLDLLAYNAEACASAAGAAPVCVTAASKGTLVGAENLTTASGESPGFDLSWRMAPNPASEWVRVWIQAPRAEEVNFQLINLSGNVLQHRKMNLNQGENRLEWNLQGLPAGWYLIRMENMQAARVERFLIVD
jgi:hypothetical protein